MLYPPSLSQVLFRFERNLKNIKKDDDKITADFKQNSVLQKNVHLLFFSTWFS